MVDIAFNEAYRIILEHLRKSGFGWVAAQIQEQVRSGKPLIKDVSPHPATSSIQYIDEEFETKPSTKGRRQRLAATENYTDIERLEIAINAIDSLVIQTTAMQEELIVFFATSMDGSQMILFEPDEFDESDALTIKYPFEKRKASVNDLKALLDMLREEAGIDNKR